MIIYFFVWIFKQIQGRAWNWLGAIFEFEYELD
ncbi:hypothetical protein J2S11_001460 [Bacillus horti]|uniref:Uncharacterized protein n=1 Tax=Caldalkalibacillus horti TaxID=77523 RepID=A0ABT9VXG2_9BACI|nr:hypothetical protein [Bacillus horti]